MREVVEDPEEVMEEVGVEIPNLTHHQRVLWELILELETKKQLYFALNSDQLESYKNWGAEAPLF
jgi:hypothetical protein